MTEKEKREAFFAEMEAAGAKKNEQKPPLYRLLWKLGIDLAPPLYASGTQLILMDVFLAGGFWAFLMWLIVWRESPGIALAGGLFFGLLFGLMMRLQIESKRKKYGITEDWSDFTPSERRRADPDGTGQPM